MVAPHPTTVRAMMQTAVPEQPLARQGGGQTAGQGVAALPDQRADGATADHTALTISDLTGAQVFGKVRTDVSAKQAEHQTRDEPTSFAQVRGAMAPGEAARIPSRRSSCDLVRPYDPGGVGWPS
jgi:hypothetical protein